MADICHHGVSACYMTCGLLLVYLVIITDLSIAGGLIGIKGGVEDQVDIIAEGIE